MTVFRETYWRVFSTELNSAAYEIKSTEEMKPSHQLSRLGASISRVLITGVLTEKENVGTPDEPMWRGRLQDIAGGTVFLNVGRFQADAAVTMAFIDPPCLVAVVGRVKSYTNEEGRTFVSVRPERIIPVNAEMQQQWLLDTARNTWERMIAIKKAINSDNLTVEGLADMGISENKARDIITAVDQYGQPDYSAFIKSIQSALRSLLPDRNVDFGFTDGGYDDIPAEETSQPAPTGNYGQQPAPATGSGDSREDIVLSLLTELNDGKGAPRDALESRCAEEGISSMELEEIIEGLLDKGLAYEPNLKYIKRIDD